MEKDNASVEEVQMLKKRKLKQVIVGLGQNTHLSTSDLLYAHGLLCHWARDRSFDRYNSHRLCDVINNFQDALRPYLVEGACDFHVTRRDDYTFRVEPIGGWDG